MPKKKTATLEITKPDEKYKFDSVTYGDLKVGDCFLHDDVYGMACVKEIRPTGNIPSLWWPSVWLVIEDRSLAFSLVKSAHSDIRYVYGSILRFAGEPVLRMNLPVVVSP